MMSLQYARAASWYIEAREESTFENEHRSKSTETEMLGAQSGKAYHYEAHTQVSVLQISDGTTAWDFHPNNEEYQTHPISTGSYAPTQTSYPAEAAAERARGLRMYFAELAGHYNSATRLPDEVLHSTGYDVPSYVVRVTTADRKDTTPSGNSVTETFWIDRKTGVVWETKRHEDTFVLSGGAEFPITIDSFTRYSTAQLGAPLPETLFHFVPPASAKPATQFRDFHFGHGMTGLTAPDVELIASDGTGVPLSSYRGQPVLLDFWSMHCPPCLQEMPKIAEIARETAANGLAVLGVNEDLMMGVSEEQDKKTAIDYLTKHNYTWPNFFDNFSVSDTLDARTMPGVVLIDAHGKIVYSGTGEDDGLQRAIAGLGPQYKSMEPAPRPEDACAIAAKQLARD